MKETSCIRQQADTKQLKSCKERITDLAPSIDKISNGLELISNKVRLQILFLLHEEKKLCVCDLSDILGMTMPAVSQHLRKLKDRNFIETERQSQTIFYSLTDSYKEILNPIFKILKKKKQYNAE